MASSDWNDSMDSDVEDQSKKVTIVEGPENKKPVIQQKKKKPNNPPRKRTLQKRKPVNSHEAILEALQSADTFIITPVVHKFSNNGVLETTKK